MSVQPAIAFQRSPNIQPRRLVQNNHSTVTKQLSEVEKNTTNAIRQYSQSIESYLRFLALCVLARLHFLSRLGTDVKQSAGQILTILFTMSGELSVIRAVVMHLGRGINNGEYFVLEDATGRSFPIHLKTIVSWEAFDVILNDRFRGKKGERRIRRKLYSLHESASHQQIDRSVNFADAFIPYQKVDMSLICNVPEVPTPGDGDSGLSSCPWCKAVSPGTLGDRVQCVLCKKHFVRVVIEADEVDAALSEAPSAPGSQNLRLGGQSSRTAEDELRHDEGRKLTPPLGPKRTKMQVLDHDSESDEENITGLAHVTLQTTKMRPRGKDSNLAKMAEDDSFESVARKFLKGDYAAASTTKSTGQDVVESRVTEVLSDSSSSYEEDPWSSDDASVNDASTNSTSGFSPRYGPYGTYAGGDYAGGYYATNLPTKTVHPSALGRAYEHTTGRLYGRFHDPYYSKRPPSPRYTSDGQYATANIGPYFSYATERRPATRAHFRTLNRRHRSDNDGYDDYEVPYGGQPSRNRGSRPTKVAIMKSADTSGTEAASQGSTSSDSSESSHLPSQGGKDSESEGTDGSKPRQATEIDAKRHRIPVGYSLKHWDPEEEPICLLGSVFDANSLGKWMFGWAVYHYGKETPVSEIAGDMWLLLIKLGGKVRRAENAIPKIRSTDNRELVEEFIDAGDRLFDKLRKLLKACEKPMTDASTGKSAQLGKDAGIAFAKTMFGKDGQLENAERWLASVRLWDLRFDANCEDILRKPSE